MTGALDLTWVQVAALSVAFFVGGFAKGGIGFAFPLLVLAIANHFVEFDLPLAIIAVLQPFINVYQFANGGKMHQTLTRFWPVIAGMTIGAPIGALLLPFVDRQLLALGVGIFILVFVGWVSFRPEIRISQQSERSVAGLSGIAAGILGVLTTINGPVFVTFLLGVRADRQMLISALGLFFIASGVLIAGAYLMIGVLTAERAVIALGCALPCALGMWAGNSAARRIDGEVFRKVVLVALFILGLNMTLRVAFGF